MVYIYLSLIVIGLAFLYDLLDRTNCSKGIKFVFYIIICTILCVFAGSRSDYNDTTIYIRDFKHTTSNFLDIFSGEFKISNVYFFQIWKFLIYNYISTDYHVYFGLSSLIIVCPSIYLIQRYSKNFTFSMIIFMFGGMYLFSLAGLKQAMATGIILMAIPFLFKRNYVAYYIACIIALFFHAYSLFFLIIPILGIEVFNKRTIIFCIAIVAIGLTLSAFSSIITFVIEFLGKDIEEEVFLEGSVNFARALVYIVPLILAIIANKRLKNIKTEEKIIIKIGILSTMFMILSLFGNPILFGRIPQYFLIGIVVSLPLYIQLIFNNKDQKTVMIIASLLYVAFGLYELYIEGAFINDIFKLIWF